MANLGRQLARRTHRHVHALTKQRLRYVITTQPLFSALADPRLGPAIALWLRDMDVIEATARECLHCGAPWDVPASVIVVEPIGKRKGLISGLCIGCAEQDGLQARVVAGLEKQLGFDPAAWRRAAASGRA